MYKHIKNVPLLLQESAQAALFPFWEHGRVRLSPSDTGAFFLPAGVVRNCGEHHFSPFLSPTVQERRSHHCSAGGE